MKNFEDNSNSDVRIHLAALRWAFALRLAELADASTDVARGRKQRIEKAAKNIESELLRLLTVDDEITETRFESLSEIRGQNKKAIPLIVELFAIVPLAPHDIVISAAEFDKALPAIIDLLELSFTPKQIRDFWKEANKIYGPRPKTGTMLLTGIGAIAAVATVFIPVIGPTMSPYVGGAAVTSFLAAIGGNMVGGMLLLTATGLAGGGILGAGLSKVGLARIVQTLGLDGLRIELVKLETTRQLLWIKMSHSDKRADAEKTAVQLTRLLREHEKIVDSERKISDPGSKLLKSFDEMTQTYKRAISRFEGWSKS